MRKRKLTISKTLTVFFKSKTLMKNTFLLNLYFLKTISSIKNLLAFISFVKTLTFQMSIFLTVQKATCHLKCSLNFKQSDAFHYLVRLCHTLKKTPSGGFKQGHARLISAPD